STGRIRLQPGERRILDLALYQTEDPELLERGDVPAPRWLHSSTLLDDGRILIAGGFTTLNSTTCPSDVVADRCFSGRATDEAFIFDPPTGRFIPVEGGMLEARGGHSATLIGGGRVLVAGGAPEAVLAVSDEDSDGPLDLRVLPIGSDGVRAHATFELFDRTDPDLSEDPTRRGFPGRGLFTGSSAEPGLPGQLNRERFLHAASAADMGRFVVLSGGIGADNPTRSYEIFDRAKPGGEGVYRDLGTLQTPRPMPSSFVLNDRVWIWGGGAADDAMDIAEVWNSEVPGTTRAVALPTSGEAGGAEFDLVRPSVAVGRTNVGGRDQEAVVVVGWYGPRCAVDGDEDMPTFEGLVRTRCVQPTSVPFRNALVREDPSGDAVLMAFPPSSSLFQSFSASALRGVDTALITGGIGNDTFETRPNILGLGFGDTRVVDARTMLEARAFHQSTLTGDQLVSTGGLTIRGGNFSMTPAFAESLVFAAE
ncbi:MAG: kelch repeat-containing protein, partial [Myxococcota bacterium]